MEVLSLFFLATIVANSHATAEVLHRTDHFLWLPSDSDGGWPFPFVSCPSWHFTVETGNREWDAVPQCENYVKGYMLGRPYHEDCTATANAAIEYAKSVTLAGDGKEIWVFDIDETTLSNLPFFVRPENAFGTKGLNKTAFSEWIVEAKAPPVSPVLRLYKTLLSLGFKTVFITARPEAESSRQATESNLKNAGYHSWLKLILRQTGDDPSSAIYKSSKRRELEEQGYRIIGNVGDQWSDLSGTNPGDRTFKLPNPMYG